MKKWRERKNTGPADNGLPQFTLTAVKAGHDFPRSSLSSLGFPLTSADVGPLPLALTISPGDDQAVILHETP